MDYIFSTRNYVDGSNGKAELKFNFHGSLQPSDNVTIYFYD